MASPQIIITIDLSEEERIKLMDVLESTAKHLGIH
jgi:hypothetical protein